MSKERWIGRCAACGREAVVVRETNVAGHAGRCPQCGIEGPWDLIRPAKTGSMSADIPPAPGALAESSGTAPHRKGPLQRLLSGDKLQ